MFAAHEIVFANGAPSESFFPGPQALGSLSAAQMRELAAIFPDLLCRPAAVAYGARARLSPRWADLPEHCRALRLAL